MSDVDLPVHSRVLAQYQRAWLTLRGDDIAVDLTVYAHPAAEIQIPFDGGSRTDQRINLGLWFAVFFTEHCSLLGLCETHALPHLRLSCALFDYAHLHVFQLRIRRQLDALFNTLIIPEAELELGIP